MIFSKELNFPRRPVIMLLSYRNLRFRNRTLLFFYSMIILDVTGGAFNKLSLNIKFIRFSVRRLDWGNTGARTPNPKYQPAIKPPTPCWSGRDARLWHGFGIAFVQQLAEFAAGRGDRHRHGILPFVDERSDRSFEDGSFVFVQFLVLPIKR